MFLLAVDQKIAFNKSYDVDAVELKQALSTNQKNLDQRLFNIDAFVLTPKSDCNQYEKDFFNMKKFDQDVQSPNSEGSTAEDIFLYDDNDASPLLDYSTSQDKNLESTQTTDEVILLEEDDVIFRKYFPDVWIDEHIFAMDSKIDFSKQLPDSVTSWRLSAFAVHPSEGLSFAEPRFINTFKKTYVEVDVPSIVRLGDVFKVSFMPVTQDSTLRNKYVKVSLNDPNEIFEFINDIPNDDTGKCFNFTTRISNHPVEVTMGETNHFLIRMLKGGNQKIKIECKNGNKIIDAMELAIRVIPNGIRQHKVTRLFINLDSNSTYNEKIEIDVPPGTQLLKVGATLHGNLIDAEISNFVNKELPNEQENDKLLKFGQAIIAHKYISTEKPNERVSEQIIEALNDGLIYISMLQSENGSFRRKLQESKHAIWFTSFIVQLLSEVPPIVNFDKALIKNALTYLASKQNADGSFPHKGEPLHSDEINNNVMKKNYMTAYTLMAFLKSRFRNSKVEGKASEFFNASAPLHDLDKAMVSHMHALEKNTDEAIKALEGFKNNYKTKTKEHNLSKQSLFAEAVSYYVLGSLEVNNSTSLIEMIKWLSENRQNISLYDELLAEQAIFEYLKETNVKNAGVTVIISNGENKKTLNVGNSTNTDSVEFSETNNKMNFDIQAVGSGQAYFDLWHEEIVLEVPSDHFSIDVSTNYDQLHVTIKALKNSFRPIVEVHLPGGYEYKSHDYIAGAVSKLLLNKY